LVTEALVCEQLPRIAPESALAGVEPAMVQRPNDYHTKPHRLTQKYTYMTQGTGRINGKVQNWRVIEQSATLKQQLHTTSSAEALKPAPCDIIRGEEKYRQLIDRRTAISYPEGVLSYRQAAGSYSVFRPKEIKSTRVTGSPPVRISQTIVVGLQQGCYIFGLAQSYASQIWPFEGV